MHMPDSVPLGIRYFIVSWT